MASAILRLPEVSKRLGVSGSTIWYRLDPKDKRHDPDMPRPFKLSPTGRSVGWLESEITDYINKRAHVRTVAGG